MKKSVKPSESKQDSFEIWLKINLNCRNYFSILFCDFPLIAWSGRSHVTISSIGCVLHT